MKRLGSVRIKKEGRGEIWSPHGLRAFQQSIIGPDLSLALPSRAAVLRRAQDNRNLFAGKTRPMLIR